MRIILFTLSFLVLLIGAALIGPSFVDWNKYKPQIITQVEKATGLNVQINGDLSLAVLPSPRVKIEGLVVVSPKKIQFENLLSMKSAEVSVALMPLLQKQIKVSSVTLVEPDIQIEILEDGTLSWQTEKMSNMKKISGVAPDEVKTAAAEASSIGLESIVLEELKIKDGKFAFINHATKSKQSAQDINIVINADSLKGPFTVKGSALYDGKKVSVNAETGKLPQANEALKIKAELTLPEAEAEFSFNGLVAIKQPYDVQGQTKINVQSPVKLAQAFGASAPISQSVSLDGLLSADENKVDYNDLKLSIGDFVGSGKFSVENIKSDNPILIKGDIKSSSILDLDSLLKGAPAQNPKTSQDDLKNVGKSEAKPNSFVPQTLTLPSKMNVDVQFDIGGVKTQGQVIKGVFLDLEKISATSEAEFKALEIPGQGKVAGTLSVFYASSSTSPKTGQITYSDPSVSYAVNGQIGQLSSFLKTFAPKADTSAVTKLYKTAQFNLNGKVTGNTFSLKDSTVKLDDMVMGLGGRYEPALSGKRAKAFIDLSAGSVDFDKIMQAQGVKKPASNDNTTSEKGSAKEALKPLQGFSLPLDLGFDISLQKARINQADLEGLRLTGDLTGKQLKLTNASINNFAGAALNLKGQVGDLSNLSGLDLTLYTKTADIQKLAQALKIDTSKLPKELKAFEANVSGKGSVNSLGFDAKIKSMGGQLDVAGNAAGLLDTPSYNNLSIGLTHPNLVKAIQIVSPDFKGQAGLSQAITMRTQASVEGKKIDLTNMAVKLGQSDFDGNLKIDASGKITSVRGTIQAGEIALDDLLGAKKSARQSGGSNTASAAPAAKERWSKTPINLDWMNTLDVDVNLSAASLKYGAWNFTKPQTALRIGNGQMMVNDMKAGIFGGQATLSTEIKASPVSLNLSSQMENIDLEKLAKALSGSGKLKSAGTVSFDVSAASTGASANALINALNGKASLDGQNVTLKGFDLAKLARGLATEEKLAVSAMSLVDGAMSGGQTKFDTVKGDYKITNGLVNIQSMVMDSAEAMIELTGSADLPKWFINVDNKITLKNVTDLEPFLVKIKGPLDNPTDTFGKNILQDYMQDKIRRKIGKELPGLLGDDVSNTLQQFGIIPKQQAPAAPAVPTPAVPAEGAVVPEVQPVAPEPEPAPEPKKIETPEDAVNELLNSETPEEAIGNVLKGLF